MRSGSLFIPFSIAVAAGLGIGLYFSLSILKDLEKDLERRERRASAKAAPRRGWQGVWGRPMSLDEKSLDPLTAARMTDHNVR